MATVQAVTDVSFDVLAGETLGLVGESGCGKSTTGRLLLRLIDADVGHGDGSTASTSVAVGPTRCASPPALQIVFQDPYASLNPRMTVERAIGGGARGPPGA